MNLLEQNSLLKRVTIIILFIIGILIRTHLDYVNYANVDMQIFFIPWYDYIKVHGILKALGGNFSQYPPLYTYSLSMMTLLPIPKVIAIKLVPMLMDFVSTFTVYKIVKLKYPSSLTPLLAAGIFLCLPTIFVNSTIWGETDSVYTSFLLISLYFFIKKQSVWGMLAFSISFALKLQSIFILPFLVVLFYKERIKLWYFFLIPGVYVILSLPVIFLGRSWIDVLTIYLQQGNVYTGLSVNAPNLYFLIPVPKDYYQLSVVISLAFACIIIGLWCFFAVKDNRVLDNKKLVLLAFISVVLAPFVIPKMHERFFYPADVFSLVLAFYEPELWFLPLAYQIVSGLSYLPFLLNISKVIPLSIATMANSTSLIFLLRKQFKNFKLSNEQAKK